MPKISSIEFGQDGNSDFQTTASMSFRPPAADRLVIATYVPVVFRDVETQETMRTTVRGPEDSVKLGYQVDQDTYVSTTHASYPRPHADGRLKAVDGRKAQARCSVELGQDGKTDFQTTMRSGFVEHHLDLSILPSQRNALSTQLRSKRTDGGLTLGYDKAEILSTYQEANRTFLAARGNGPSDIEKKLEEVARKNNTDPATGEVLDAATLVKKSRVELGTEYKCDFSTTNFMPHPGVQPRTQSVDPKAWSGILNKGSEDTHGASYDAVILGYDTKDLRSTAMDQMGTVEPKLKQVYIPVVHTTFIKDHPALDVQREMLAQSKASTRR